MSLSPLYVCLGEVSVQALCPFFNWDVCLPGVELCEFFIYFGDQTLSEVSFANMFSHTFGSLFILMLSIPYKVNLFDIIRCLITKMKQMYFKNFEVIYLPPTFI